MFASALGQQLTNPESGWQRYNDNSSYINYVGNWTYSTVETGCYMTDRHYGGNYANFYFQGTKLRLIADITPNYDSNNTLQVIIDGNTYYYNQYSASAKLLICTFEVLNLENKIHNVILTNNVGCLGFNIDAVDIDSTGSLLNNSLASINITGASSSMKINDTQQLTAMGTYLDNTIGNITNAVTWESSNDSIATVSSSGLVTAVSSGSVIITATKDGITSSPIAIVSSPEGTNAKLLITMMNGTQKEYDMTSAQVDSFLNWFDNRFNGIGKSYYIINNTNNTTPFLSRRQYIIFDKILDFEIMDYTN